MINPFLSKSNLEILQEKLKEFVNSKMNYLNQASLDDPRSVGAGIEKLIIENINEIFTDPKLEYIAALTRRSMADFTFSDTRGYHYSIDIKTHSLDAEFSMPNLTANRKLIKLYETPQGTPENYFMIMIFSYKIVNNQVSVDKVIFTPIENLDWTCLRIGALGWGQIQLKNSNIISINYSLDRKNWMIELCNKTLKFYPNEIEKIEHRIHYFEKAKKYWTIQ
jgi:hypothetical protein